MCSSLRLAAYLTLERLLLPSRSFKWIAPKVPLLSLIWAMLGMHTGGLNQRAKTPIYRQGAVHMAGASLHGNFLRQTFGDSLTCKDNAVLMLQVPKDLLGTANSAKQPVSLKVRGFILASHALLDQWLTER